MSIVTLAILSFVYGVTATVKETDCAVVAVSIVVSVMAKPKRLLVRVMLVDSNLTSIYVARSATQLNLRNLTTPNKSHSSSKPNLAIRG